MFIETDWYYAHCWLMSCPEIWKKNSHFDSVNIRVHFSLYLTQTDVLGQCTCVIGLIVPYTNPRRVWYVSKKYGVLHIGHLVYKIKGENFEKTSTCIQYRALGLTHDTMLMSNFWYLFCVKQRKQNWVETHQAQLGLVCATMRQMHHSNTVMNQTSTPSSDF